jgi:ketosteroid isomerase-like protein
MSEANVDVVRAIYEAWEKRTPVDHLVAPDLEYVNPPYAVEGGTVRDRRALGRVLDVYADFRIEEKQFIDAGDDVVVIGVARGTGASGVPIELRQGYVWTIENGRAIRFRWFNAPDEALAAAGLGK